MAHNMRKMKVAALAILIVLGSLMHTRSAGAASSEILVVAGGCFWCVEADFERIKGVIEVETGYTGGKTENPTYKQVSKGGTGHFEAARIRFDPNTTSRAELLDLYFRSVDPTDAGGQFCDRGDSYRTAIFVSSETEEKIAKAARATASRQLGKDVVTPVLSLGAFYPAEAYHQDYYKSGELVITRFGPKTKSEAYKLYRQACGRDTRVLELWGNKAAFAGSS